MTREDFFEDLPEELVNRYKNLLEQLISLDKIDWSKPFTRERIHKTFEILEKKAKLEFEIRKTLLEALETKK
ncbi:MAG: hypothetical protein GYA60_06320 [Candidatus Methanofastidiosa archaeon]|jgi:hypothetical protein|nr:hypothetical protein [Candidatus Methanofastidiosa archaeon]